MNLKAVSFALFALGLATAIDQARAEQFTVDSPKISAWMWSQTNAYRKANGVPGLIIEPKIVLVAPRIRGIAGPQEHERAYSRWS